MLACCGILPAQASAPAAPQGAAKLQAIEWMIGGTWAAEARAPDGKVTRVESRVQWAPNGQAIQFTTTFNGVPQYSGIYAWDPVRQAIAFFYTSRDGELTTGTVVPTGNVLTLDFTIAYVDGKTGTLRSVMKRDGGDAYDWSVLSNKNGVWTTMIALRYTRQPDTTTGSGD